LQKNLVQADFDYAQSDYVTKQIVLCHLERSRRVIVVAFSAIHFY